jgi:hypothetical protein
MTSHLQKKREAMIKNLHAEVGDHKLVVCMMLVFQKRRERAGQVPDFRLGSEQNIELMLADFLQTCSMQQLRMLRKMAHGLTSDVITDPQKLKEIVDAGRGKVVITEKVKPPTEH